MAKTEIMTDRKTGEQIEVRARDGKEVDEWDMLKALSREKRARRQASAPQFLQRLRNAGLRIELLSAYHVRVEGRWDYWPTTGRWWDLEKRRKGYGAKQLIAAILKVKEAARAKD
jgi:Holliday junction resolvase-like predicted endonuclease